VFEFDTEAFLGRNVWTVVDEASMVNEEMATDLRATGARLLWVGDHGQLPPIGVDPGIMRNPDAKLETVCRQAESSPIIRLAHWVRTGHPFRDWKSAPEAEVVRSMTVRNVASTALRAKAQILVGFNNSRILLNRECRKQMGFTGDIVVGERLICLRNDYRRRMFNGQQFEVVELDESALPGCRYARLRSVDDGSERDADVFVPCLGRGPKDDEPEGASLMDYAYAITVHKSQGSEWPTVVLVDATCKHWDDSRWRYTAITRAKNRVIVFL
jgi:exodeoxyribonuclease-5